MNQKYSLLFVMAISLFILVGCSKTSIEPLPQEVPEAETGGGNMVEETLEEGRLTSPSVEDSTYKQFTITSRQWEFEPDEIRVNQGDTVKLLITSEDVAHGFTLPVYKINERLEPGGTFEVEFVADIKGVHTFYCSVPCGSGHPGMNGMLIVE